MTGLVRVRRCLAVLLASGAGLAAIGVGSAATRGSSYGELPATAFTGFLGSLEGSLALPVVSLPRPRTVVVIMVDDQPPLDGRLLHYEPTVQGQIASRGATFSDFHAESPLCCPARAGFLTGQHTHNHGVVDNNAALFDPRMSLATQAQAAGYRTCLSGKYFNGYGSNPKGKNPYLAPFVPPGWSQQCWAAFGHPAYYDYTLFVNGGSEAHGSAPADYSTDVVADHAVQEIASTPASQPLFLWVAPFSVHAGFIPAPRYNSSAYNCSKADQYWKPANWNEADVTDKPAYVRAIPPLAGVKGSNLNSLCRAIRGVDDLTRRVLSALVQYGRWAPGDTDPADQPLIVYTGDNGMNEGEHRLDGKTAPYETQVPFYVRWDGVIPSGTTIGERLQNIDLAPTLCQLIGCSMGPYPNGQRVPDGISFASLLDGTADGLPRQYALDEMSVPAVHSADINTPPWSAVTSTAAAPVAGEGCASAATQGCRWHYIVDTATGEQELYDVSGGPCHAWSPGKPGDPCELRNLVAPSSGALIADSPAMTDVLQVMRQARQQLAVEKGSPLYGP